MKRIQLFDWHPKAKDARMALLVEEGYDVTTGPPDPEGMRNLREDPPAAVVISLDRRPSQGRDIALYLRKTKATRGIPIVIVGGDPEKVKAMQEHLPDAFYTTWDAVVQDLAKAISNPPTDPVVPKSVFDPYAGTPLPKKLGIRAGYRVGLIDAPNGFEETLGELPPDVTLVHQPQTPRDLLLWFVREQAAFHRRLSDVSELSKECALWVIWPKKASGVASDLSQPVVRTAGLSAGLVDYKVCSVDQIWTGLCFRWRKEKPGQ